MMFLHSVGAERSPSSPGYSTPNPGSPPRVLALVTRFSRSCRRRFLTHICATSKVLSAGGVTGLLPIGGQAQAPTARWLFVQGSAFLHKLGVCVLCFLPIHSGHQVRWTYQPGSHRIFNPPSFCGACLDFCREKDSAFPFPRRP